MPPDVFEPNVRQQMPGCQLYTCHSCAETARATTSTLHLYHVACAQHAWSLESDRNPETLLKQLQLCLMCFIETLALPPSLKNWTLTPGAYPALCCGNSQGCGLKSRAYAGEESAVLGIADLGKGLPLEGGASNQEPVKVFLPCQLSSILVIHGASIDEAHLLCDLLAHLPKAPGEA